MKKSIVYSIIITLAMLAQAGAHSILRDANSLDRGQVANFLLQNSSITKQGNDFSIDNFTNFNTTGNVKNDDFHIRNSTADDQHTKFQNFRSTSDATHVKLTGDTMSGNLAIESANPALSLDSTGGGTMKINFAEDGPNAEVGRDTNDRLFLTPGNNSGKTYITEGNFGITVADPTSRFDISGGSITVRGANAGLRVGDSVFLVETGGNVGIGTTDASSIFDVFNGSITVRGTDSGLRVEGISRFQSEVVFSSQVNIILGSSDNVTIDGETNARSIRRGVVRINHKPGTEGTRALFINTDRHSQGNTHSLHINYHADGMTAGTEEEVAEFVVISSNATGGEINALEVNKIGTGTVKVNAVSAGIDVHVISQKSGVFSGVDGGFTYDGATYITAVSSFNVDNSTGDIDLWGSNDDYVVWGSSSLFDESEFLFSSVATKDLNLIFQFSTGTHLGEDAEEGGWVTFPSINSTIEGGQSAGLVSWDQTALVELGWATTTVQGVHDIYWIRAQRNRSGGVGTITERIIQVDAGDTIFFWDKDGNVRANAFSVGVDTPTSSIDVVGGSITVRGTDNGLHVRSLAGFATVGVDADGNFIEGTGGGAAAGDTTTWTGANVYEGSTTFNKLVKIATALHVLADVDDTGGGFLLQDAQGNTWRFAIVSNGWLQLFSEDTGLQTPDLFTFNDTNGGEFVIGDASPAGALFIVGDNENSTFITMKNTQATWRFRNFNTAVGGRRTGDFVLDANSTNYLILQTDGKMMLDNTRFGGAVGFHVRGGSISVKDGGARLEVGSATASNFEPKANFAFVYSSNVSGVTQLKFMADDGTIAQGTDHCHDHPFDTSGELFPRVSCDEQMILGAKRSIHISRMARLVQEIARGQGLLGPTEEIIHEEFASVPTWDERQEAKRAKREGKRAWETSQEYHLAHGTTPARGLSPIYKKRSAPKWIADRTPPQ